MIRKLWIGCGVVVANNDGDLLLVEEGSGPAVGRWSFPAGKLEVGERLTEAAMREAREETGLVVELDDLIGVYHSPLTVEDTYGINFVFRGSVLGGEICTSPAHPQVRFVPRAEVAAMMVAEKFRSSELIATVLSDVDSGRSHPLHLVTTLAPVTPT